MRRYILAPGNSDRYFRCSRCDLVASALPLILMLTLCLGGPLQAQVALVLTNVYSFAQGSGAQPAGLLQASDGNIYGVTFAMIFRLDPKGGLTNIYTFTNGGPVAGLVEGSDGYFYGTTYWGGTNGHGTVFRVSTNGDLVVLHSFAGGNEGRNPITKLVQAGDGYFYGATDQGGTSDSGTVFRISAQGDFATLYSFPYAGRPRGLMLARDGNLYGTTQGGGTNYYGTVFRISTSGVFTNLHLFTAGNDGAQPTAGLVQARDGYLYGCTSYGGAERLGTLFRISTNGQTTTLHSWAAHEGRTSFSDLIQGADGDLYGAAREGGRYAPTNCGTVFRITTSGTLVRSHSFTSGLDGGRPNIALVQARDGSFYGMTGLAQLDCHCWLGTIYRVIPTEPAAPVLQVTLTHSHQILFLSWNTEPSLYYQLQYTSDLNHPNWTNLGSAVSAYATELAYQSTYGSERRFFRVVLLRQ